MKLEMCPQRIRLLSLINPQASSEFILLQDDFVANCVILGMDHLLEMNVEWSINKSWVEENSWKLIRHILPSLSDLDLALWVRVYCDDLHSDQKIIERIQEMKTNCYGDW